MHRAFLLFPDGIVPDIDKASQIFSYAEELKRMIGVAIHTKFAESDENRLPSQLNVSCDFLGHLFPKFGPSLFRR